MVTYKEAGVDIDASNKAKKLMGQFVKSTRNANVLADIGSFGGMYQFDSGKFKKPVLVSSSDGVGTKVKLAFLTGNHKTVGQDLINHCVNDILVQGAMPMFFMDYIGTGKLTPEVVAQIVEGLSIACKENGLVLLGGETAEMPGVYKENEYDLAGFIVGVVDKDQVINGSNIKEGDKVIGLASTGLHTNGYSLALKVLDLYDSKIVEALMAVHKSYLPVIKPLLGKIKGLAHITGGGLVENIPRILPENVDVNIEVNWDIPEIFKLIQDKGNVPEDDMWRTFNMGIGMVIICASEDAEFLAKKASGTVIGEVVKGSCKINLKR